MFHRINDLIVNWEVFTGNTDDYILISDSQDVEALKESVFHKDTKFLEDYDAFFVKVENADYVEILGIDHLYSKYETVYKPIWFRDEKQRMFQLSSALKYNIDQIVLKPKHYDVLAVIIKELEKLENLTAIDYERL